MDEWQEASLHRLIKQPHLHLTTVDASDKYRILITKDARRQIGELEYVRIALSTANGEHKIWFIPSNKNAVNTRRIRTKGSGSIAIGGGASLVKKYNFPLGYYVLDDNGVFTWRYAER